MGDQEEHDREVFCNPSIKFQFPVADFHAGFARVNRIVCVVEQLGRILCLIYKIQ